MKPSLQFKLSQSLTLTPQLQQSIRLLQLSTLELEQEVEQMLADNPLLEQDDEDTASTGSEAVTEPEFKAAESGLDDTYSTEYTPGSDILSSQSTVSTKEYESENNSTELDAPDWKTDNAPSSDLDFAFSEGGGASDAGAEDDDFDPASNVSRGITLNQHLREQLAGRLYSEADRFLAQAVIDSINEDGFFTDSFDELAESLGAFRLDAEAREALHEQLQVALKLVQSFDPPGVAARDMAECLRLQLQMRAARSAGGVASPLLRIALQLCSGTDTSPADAMLSFLAKRDYKRLARYLDCDEEDIRAAQQIIATLNPRPSAGFESESARPVVPDVLVQRIAGVNGHAGTVQFRATLNPEVMPKLRVNQLYANILKGRRGDNVAGLQTQLQEARWFIKNVQQRFETILRVSQCIVERQRNFFLMGEAGMRPLVLKDVADLLGLHESTISRVTSSKYMHTPWGTFELKYFFTSGVSTDTGGSASSTAVKSIIKKLVDGEDPAHPLSDNDLADKLSEQGIVIARRTVAKYREALRIAPTSMRRI